MGHPRRCGAGEGRGSLAQEVKPGPRDWPRDQEGKGQTKGWLDYIGKGIWGKGSPAYGLKKFRVAGEVCQPYPVTGAD